MKFATPENKPATGRPAVEPRDARKLFFIKAIHTLVWLVLSSTVLYVLWSGISGIITARAWFAVIVVAGEGLVLLLFGGKCPLTVVARQYSASQKDNFDIFLPNWFARHNKLICTLLYAVGLVLMVFRYFRQA